MNKIAQAMAATACLFTSVTAGADELTFGLGFGSLYNGMGANIGRISRDTMSYASVGCIGFSSGTSTDENSTDRKYSSNCGLGMGILNTGLIFDSNKHGLGLGLGVTINQGNLQSNQDNKTEYHLRFSYNYFLNGIPGMGLNLGLAPQMTFSDNNEKAGLLLNIGYQF